MAAQKVTMRNIKDNWVLVFLLAPTLIGVAIFAYIPAIEAIRHSFYNWDSAFTEEYVGLANVEKLLGSLPLWTPLLLAAFSCGLSALIDHPFAKRFLRIAGIVLFIFTFGLMIKDASTLKDFAVNVNLGIMIGGFVLCLGGAFALGTGKLKTSCKVLSYIFAFAMGVAYLVTIKKVGDHLLWKSFNLIFILVIANLFKMWPSIFTAVCIHRLKSEKWQYWYRVLFVIPMIIPQMVGLLIWKFFYDPNVGVLNKVLITFKIDQLLIWMDKWVLHLGVFNEPFKPAWLGEPSLVIPALVFWGFPWVGVVGVLIYLAGLQNISNDVYEAAELDGITWWGKFWQIELPLIMTQVRLNLILMIIGTFQAYGFQYILLGAEGGPDNKGLTPGLYMFYRAFQEQDYGYACAIGLILFVIILVLTIVNQKYVRVKK